MKSFHVAADPDMTLADWAALIERLVDQYGADAYMYINAGRNNAQLRISDEPANLGTGRPV